MKKSGLKNAPMAFRQKDARQMRAWDLATKGWNLSAIARQLETEGMGKVTSIQIGKYVREFADRMWNEMKSYCKYQKVRQTDGLTYIYKEALDAWDLSSWEIWMEEVTDKKSKKKIKVERKRKIPGDSRYLMTAMQALADIRKLWGMNEPDRVEHSGPEGEPIAIQVSVADLEEVSKEYDEWRLQTYPVQQPKEPLLIEEGVTVKATTVIDSPQSAPFSQKPA